MWGRATDLESSLAGCQAACAPSQLSTDPHVTRPGHTVPCPQPPCLQHEGAGAEPWLLSFVLVAEPCQQTSHRTQDIRDKREPGMRPATAFSPSTPTASPQLQSQDSVRLDTRLKASTLTLLNSLTQQETHLADHLPAPPLPCPSPGIAGQPPHWSPYARPCPLWSVPHAPLSSQIVLFLCSQAAVRVTLSKRPSPHKGTQGPLICPCHLPDLLPPLHCPSPLCSSHTDLPAIP